MNYDMAFGFDSNKDRLQGILGEYVTTEPRDREWFFDEYGYDTEDELVSDLVDALRSMKWVDDTTYNEGMLGGSLKGTIPADLLPQEHKHSITLYLIWDFHHNHTNMHYKTIAVSGGKATEVGCHETHMERAKEPTATDLFNSHFILIKTFKERFARQLMTSALAAHKECLGRLEEDVNIEGEVASALESFSELSDMIEDINYAVELFSDNAEYTEDFRNHPDIWG